MVTAVSVKLRRYTIVPDDTALNPTINTLAFEQYAPYTPQATYPAGTEMPKFSAVTVAVADLPTLATLYVYDFLKRIGASFFIVVVAIVYMAFRLCALVQDIYRKGKCSL